jgi:hypothetical protein
MIATLRHALRSDGTAKIWDAATGEEILTLPEHREDLGRDGIAE